MTNTDMINKVRSIITLVASDNRMEPVFPTETLEGLGIDSLDRYEIALQIEQHFNIDIEDGTSETWMTVQDVIDSVSNELGYEAEARRISSIEIDPKSAISADGQAALNNMPVINHITREDVDVFAATIRNNDPMIPHELDNYQRIATKSAIYPGQGTPLGLDYVALKINGEAGEFAEHVGKAMRDDGLIAICGDQEVITDHGPLPTGRQIVAFNDLTDARKTAIVKELGDILWYLSAAANELNMTLSEIALANLEKLCDRSERDALRGSGDER